MKYYEHIFLGFTYFVYFLYFLIYFKLWGDASQYLNEVQYFLQIYVSLLLIYFFNPLMYHKFNIFHKRLAFSAGIMLFTSISFDILSNKIKNIYTFLFV